MCQAIGRAVPQPGRTVLQLPPALGRAEAREREVTPKRVAWFGLALLVAIAALRWLGSDGEKPASGPRSSSLATAPEGVAAYASLLGRSGHRVRRLRITVDERAPDPGWTVALLDPDSVRAQEARALARFAQRGGRLILAGAQAEAVIDALGVPSLNRETGAPGPAVLRPVADLPETEGVRRVRTEGDDAFTDPPGTPLLAGPTGPVATVLEAGAGQVVVLASAATLDNARLGQADNAAWALNLAGAPGRTVAFVESVHGYERATGLAAIPRRMAFTLAGLALAALLFALSRARRFGDPEATERALDPPRRLYVEALAASLLRTKDRAHGGAPVRLDALDRLAELEPLPAHPTDDQVRLAARAAGLPDDEAAALARPGGDLLATGRARATLRGAR